MSEAHSEAGESVAKKVFVVTMVGVVLFCSAAFIIAFTS